MSAKGVEDDVSVGGGRKRVGDSGRCSQSAVFAIIALLLTSLLAVGCGLTLDNSQSARNKLTELGIPFTEAEFLRICSSSRNSSQKAGPGDLAKLFIASGMNPNTADKSGESAGTTALMLASQAGNVEVVKILLKSGAVVDAFPDKVVPPFDYLMEAHKTVKLQSGPGRLTALLFAAFAGHADVARILLEAGANPNNQDRFGHTPLHYACRGSGKGDIVRALLEAGADPNVSNCNRSTPLMLAVYEGNKASVESLLEREADCTKKNLWGRTALDQARLLSGGEGVIYPNASVTREDYADIIALLTSSCKAP